MKKALLLVLVSIFLLLAFASCTALFEEKLPEPPKPPHVHEYSQTWVSEGGVHFRECSCGAEIDAAAHVDLDKDDICDVCLGDVPVPEVVYTVSVKVSDTDGKLIFGNALSVEHGNDLTLNLMVGVEYTVDFELITVLDEKIQDGFKIYTVKLERVVEDIDISLVGTLCDHSWIDATCTNAKYCEICTLADGEPLGHDLVYATCTEATYCQRCDYVDGDPLGHTPGGEPTCTEPQLCTVCQTELAPALGHTPGDEPTCTEPQLCTVCQTELAPATGHTEGEPVVENSIAPDCENAGSYDNVVYCTVCGEELARDTVTVDALVHTEGETVVENGVAPDCENAGSYDNVVYCTVCGEELTRENVTVDALGHTEGETVVENNVAPDCENAGSYDNVVYCTVCGEELERETVTVDALGHTEGETVVENNVAPDCENTGSYDNVVYCTVCGEELARDTVTVAALGHTEGEIVVENNEAPDCENAGSYDNVVYCTVCGEELTRETVTVAALGHTADEPTVENNVAPDCENGGHYDSVVYCTVCGEELSRNTVSVDPTGHTPGDEPTCTEPQLCTVCQVELSPALGHDYSDTWKSDESAHWYECHCGDKKDVTAHAVSGSWSFNNSEHWHECECGFVMDKADHEPAADDGNCETAIRCKYCSVVVVEAITHNPTNTWSKDSTSHWHACQNSGCSAKCDEQKHVSSGPATENNAEICTVCEYVITPELNHTCKPGNVVIENNDNPTCTEAGSYDKVTYCTGCGTETSRETVTVDPIGHDYDDGALTKNPTCTENGVKTYTCSHNPSHTYTEEIDSLGHTEEEIPGTEPTCTSTGLTAGVKCSVCEVILTNQEVIPAIEHKYTAYVSDDNATCEQDGTKTAECDYGCGTKETVADTGSKRDHKYTTYVSNNDATCVQDGTKTAECVYGCGTKDTVTDEGSKKGHTPGEAVQEDVFPATCYSEGSYNSVVYCTVESCKAKLSSTPKSIAKLAHTPGAAVDQDVVPATCYSEGSYNSVVYCTAENCGAKLSSTPKKIAKLAHTPGTAVVENEVIATCYSKGSYDSVVYCSVEGCGAKLSSTSHTTDMIAHTPADAVKENEHEATCTEAASYESVVYCSVEDCKAEISRTPVTEGEALGHTAGNTVVENSVAPDCENTGSYDNVVYCTVCGDELERETVTVVATGHTEGETEVENNVAPDCDSTGSYDNVVYCTVCGDELERETVTVDATGHTEEELLAVAPTCESTGLTAGVKCSVCQEVLTAQTVVPSLGHDWAAATCTAPKTCKRDNCGATEGEALDHDWAEATCTAPKTCKRDNCGATEGDALGHEYTEIIQDEEHIKITAENCQSMNVYWYDCSRCNANAKNDANATDKYYTGTVAGDHNYSSVVTNPTCTTAGYTTYTCVCGDTYQEAGAAALTHDWAAATCTAPKTCKRDNCGATEGDALDHSWNKTECDNCDATRPAATFYINGNEDSSLARYGESINMPENIDVPSGYYAHSYSFVGWAKASINETNEEPDFYAPGTVVSISSNSVFYAVFTYSKVDAAQNYTKYSGTITEGYYIIVYDGGALSDSVSDKDRFNYLDVTASNNIISSPAESIIWRILKDGDYYTIYNESVGKYAAGSGTKNEGALIDDVTDYAKWSVSGNGTYEFVNHGNSVKGINCNLRRNGTYGFACYSTSTGGALSLYRFNETFIVTYTSTLAECQHEEQTTTDSATCYAPGRKIVTCDKCNYVILDEASEIKDHAYSSEVTTTPTCGSAGERTYTCGTCGHTKTESIPATNVHTFGAWTFVDPDHQRSCSGCSETETLTPSEMVDYAYQLQVGESLNGTITLTGIITSIEDPYSAQYNNVSVIIDVDGTTDKPILCFRLKGEKAEYIAVGDTITVTGNIKNYEGTIEFDANCEYVSLICGTHNFNGGATCIKCGAENPDYIPPESGDDTETVTVTTVIADYASGNGWSNSTQYSTINMDSIITVTANGSSDTGKYYENGNNWRVYQTESGTITITASNNAVISSVIITYNISNSGVLLNGSTKVTSGMTVTVNASSITFAVGNSGSATNGQVRITQIEVVYTVSTGSSTPDPEPEHTCQNACPTCGMCTNAECTYDVCKNNQCEGHDVSISKATSISVNDVVYLVCEAKTMQLSGISTTSTKYGIGVAYTEALNPETYSLTVVQGSSAGTYAFKTNDGKYLSWSSGNSLTTSTTIDENSSWTVEFVDGNAIIKNAKDNSRKLRWNASSPRFACYTSEQTAIQLYKKG